MIVLLRTAVITLAFLVAGCASRSHDRWSKGSVDRPPPAGESPSQARADITRESFAPAPRQGSREAWWSLRQGMTQAEVLQLLGEPRSKSVYAASRQEVWWWGPANVTFEPIGGRLIAWDTPDF